MTVSYSAEVANSSKIGCFWRILCKWKGSVYKLIWRELVMFLVLYYVISFTYRFVLTEAQQTIFEKLRKYFIQKSESIPMSFVLGFYVTLIVRRWWEQYRLLPWPDSLALFVSAAISGTDERGRLMRRNIVRYSMLSYVITLQKVSFRVKKRFPSYQHMVDAGLMMECEKKIFDMMDAKTEMSKYWMPLIWATNIINRARKESLIISDHLVQTLLMELSDIRKRLGSLIGYDTVCVPLVYTQVVTLSVYTYFLSTLMGRQFVREKADESMDSEILPDMYFPFFTVLQFAFYIGWLKVAEVLINPFGEDDDDIELNWLIDRHLKAGYMIVDEMHEEHPELLKDQYWDEVVPKELPYTVGAGHYRRTEPKGSAENYKVKDSESVYANIFTTKKNAHEEYADYESVDTPIAERRMNWFQRKLHRRSSTYSSGLFGGRTRHNSVYSSPETAVDPNAPDAAQLQHKMSLYDRLVGRKSGRHRRDSKQGSTKMNGGVPVNVKNRPRIPTPDVTKEVVDREHRLAILGNSGILSHPSTYPGDSPTIVQVMLSPIQEMDSPPSTGTITMSGSSSPGTAALAQAVLSPALTTAGVFTPGVLTPVAVSPIITTTLAPTVTKITEENEESGDRSRKTSVVSQQQKRGEVYV